MSLPQTDREKKMRLIQEIQTEITRFQKRLQAAYKEQQEDGDRQYQFHHLGAAKRGALDLKKELNKLTQIGKFL